ncbi:hypothetical protein JMF89_06910 [Clostridiaceae bacterium UIB06]|uniref:SWIM-type domain-containing protein n=1 Tax=Clostridium thailandense TaxID=2794346 RepID=A0A949TYF4_9CLOT|nr:SWIM zinc finger family protein [Clostridium thailandense]MBV7273895.1 hypothetical protein [Clostridium thailandense]MCH5136930.1 hypothetical protein [Clostridiaceae bacterium UIB06]
MDSRDNFLEKMKNFLLTIDEEYLIGISNKGIVNRAKKDLEASNKVDIEIEEEAVKCTLADDTICFLKDNIKEYKCSCPSRSLCKHVVMSYMYLKNNINIICPSVSENSEVQTENKSFDFTKLLNINTHNLPQIIGEKIFNEAVKRIKFGIEAQIEEGSILTIRFKEENYIVKIMANNKEGISEKEILEEAMCSCKSKEICRHKVEGILKYQLYKKLIKEEDLKLFNKKSSLGKESYSEAAKTVKKLMEDILFMGLSRMPESTLEKLESTALLCHNYNIPNLEKSLRAVKSELDLYFKKNASFSTRSLRNKLSKIYAAASAIESCKDEEMLYNLCGEHKSSYYDIPTIDLYGIGAESWSSKSGYEGITYYYYEENRGSIFTYTNSRPTYYDNKKKNSQTAYSYTPSFGIEGNTDDISKCHIRLSKGKINGENRISASEESRGEVLEVTDIHKLNLKDIFVNKWYKLLEGYPRTFMGTQNENSNLYIIKPEEFGKSNFDNIKQSFTMALYDKEGKEINMIVNFSKETKAIIQKLERIDRLKKYPEGILVKAYIIDGKLSVMPITLYYEDMSIENLTL